MTHLDKTKTIVLLNEAGEELDRLDIKETRGATILLHAKEIEDANDAELSTIIRGRTNLMVPALQDTARRHKDVENMMKLALTLLEEERKESKEV